MYANIFIILCLFQSTHQKAPHDYRNAWHFPNRLLKLIKMYNERGMEYIDEVLEIIPHYEESHYFEMGYVMSEILERYRKMVGIAQRPQIWKMDSVFQTVKYLELIQKLFFEIYHLVNMFSEINTKYDYVQGQDDSSLYDPESLAKADKMIQRIEEIQRIRYLEKKKRLKQMKKERQLYLKGGKIWDKKSHPRRPINKFWPIDYGWEVNYKWWE